jgi:hypothetical protein
MIYIKRILFAIFYAILFIGVAFIFVLSCVAEPFALFFHYLKKGEVKTRCTLYEFCYVIDKLDKIVDKLKPDKND